MKTFVFLTLSSAAFAVSDTVNQCDAIKQKYNDAACCSDSDTYSACVSKKLAPSQAPSLGNIVKDYFTEEQRKEVDLTGVTLNYMYSWYRVDVAECDPHKFGGAIAEFGYMFHKLTNAKVIMNKGWDPDPGKYPLSVGPGKSDMLVGWSWSPQRIELHPNSHYYNAPIGVTSSIKQPFMIVTTPDKKDELIQIMVDAGVTTDTYDSAGIKALLNANKTTVMCDCALYQQIVADISVGGVGIPLDPTKHLILGESVDKNGEKTAKTDYDYSWWQELKDGKADFSAASLFNKKAVEDFGLVVIDKIPDSTGKMVAYNAIGGACSCEALYWAEDHPHAAKIGKAMKMLADSNFWDFTATRWDSINAVMTGTLFGEEQEKARTSSTIPFGQEVNDDTFAVCGNGLHRVGLPTQTYSLTNGMPIHGLYPVPNIAFPVV